MAQQRRLNSASGFEQVNKAQMGDPMAISEVGAEMDLQVPPDAKLRMPQAASQSGDPAFGGTAQSQTKPREIGAIGGGGQATPSRPRSPQPAQGAVSPAPQQGLVPFQPMAGPDLASMATPAGGGLYGSLGGLKGGGLGLPLDPINDAQEDPLSGLIAMLMKARG